MTFKYVIYKMRGGVEGCEGPRVIWTVDLPRIPCSVQAIRIYIEAENRSAKPKSRDCCSWMSKCTGLYHVRVVLPLMCSLVCVVCSLCLNHSCIFSNNSSNNLIDKQFDKTFVLSTVYEIHVVSMFPLQENISCAFSCCDSSSPPRAGSWSGWCLPVLPRFLSSPSCWEAAPDIWRSYQERSVVSRYSSVGISVVHFFPQRLWRAARSNWPVTTECLFDLFAAAKPSQMFALLMKPYAMIQVSKLL